MRSIFVAALTWAAVAECAQAAAPLGVEANATSGLAGTWIVSNSPSYPGVRTIQIEGGGDAVTGEMVTDWYGPLPMQGLRVEHGQANFLIDNGNPRLRAKPWSLRLEQGRLHIVGDVWYQHVDIFARRGSEAEAAALAFKVLPLPPLHRLPDNGLARTPPMGWNSWNKFAEKIDDRTVREVADAMVTSGLRDAGYVYINIDDGWQGERDAHGVLQPNAKFPDIKALADYVHSKGLKLGIYSSPGPKSCAGYPGTYGHVEQDAKTWAAWGVDYLKYDLCSGEGFYRTQAQIQATYQQMGAALQATGRPIVFSLGEYGRYDVGKWGREVSGNLWRTTGDISDDYAKMAHIGFDSDGSPGDAGPGGWNDADMLEVGNGGMSEPEYRTHMILWAMLAAPLLTGNDVRSMTPATLKLLTDRHIIAVNQDTLGREGRRVFRRGDIEVWSRPLAGGALAVAVFNRATAPASDVAVNWSDLGLGAPNAKVLWTDGEGSSSAAGLSVSLAGHDAALFKVAP